MAILKRLSDVMSPSVRITFFNYFLKFIFKFLLLLFVPMYLSSEEMGYWYTFISVAALTTFADLGFTSIITQFTAHEIVNIHFDEKKRNFIVEDDESLGRISSLFKFTVKWSGFLTLLCTVAIFLIGCVLFYKDINSLYVWFVPWIIYALASSAGFFNRVILAFFEGCNQIATSQKINILNALILNGLGVIGITLGWGLYALSVPMLLSVTVSFMQIIIYYHSAIKKLIKCPKNGKTNWMSDILRLLWRYAISWISGYFIFQIYNPIVFSIYGAEEAGMVGYILTIVSALVSIANVWSYVSVPKLNILTELQNWNELNSEYKKNLLLIELTFAVEIMCCFLAAKLPYIGAFMNKYIFSYGAFAILSVGYFIQLAASYIGVYLRSHKEEPLMYISVLGAIISASMTLISVLCLQLEWIYIGFTLSNLITFPFVLKIKSQKIKKWHE